MLLRRALAQFYAECAFARRRCHAPFGVVVVRPDGNVRFCPDEWIDDYPLGNVRHETVAAIWNNDGGRALMLEMGTATLELFDERQAEVIDQLEAGKRVSGQVRFALQVPDLKSAMERLLAHGATLVHPPVQMPWGDYNVRLQDPDGVQVTLFQAAGKEDE